MTGKYARHVFLERPEVAIKHEIAYGTVAAIGAVVGIAAVALWQLVDWQAAEAAARVWWLTL